MSEHSINPLTAPMETLDRDDFVLEANSGAGSLQTVAEHIVPRGEARLLMRHPGRLTLGARDDFEGDGVVTVFNLTHDIIRNGRGFSEPAVVTIDGDPVDIVEGAPGAGEASIDHAANTITFGEAPDNATDIVVFYPVSEGRWTLEVFSPNERRHETYANGSVRGVNGRPQDDVNSPFMVNHPTPWLVQDTILRLQVDSSAIVNWDAENPFSQIELPFTRRPLTQLSRDELAAAQYLLGA